MASYTDSGRDGCVSPAAAACLKASFPPYSGCHLPWADTCLTPSGFTLNIIGERSVRIIYSSKNTHFAEWAI